MKEKTLVVIKPDGIQRSLIGEVIKRYEQVGLKLMALKMLNVNDELVEKHYLIDPEWKRKVGEKAIASYEKKGLTPPISDPVEVGSAVLNRLKKYMTACPVIAMVWEGHQAVELVRKITGGTEPMTSDVGTIRGDYTLDSYSMSDQGERAIRNIIHASGSLEDAAKEIELWFKPEEIFEYRLVAEEILYDVNLDGLKE